MIVFSWIVLGMFCWMLSGLVVGIVLGKAIKANDVSVASTSHLPDRESRSDVAA